MRNDLEVSVSVVSHGQMALVSNLLGDIAQQSKGVSLEVILTLNVPEEIQHDFLQFDFPVRVLRNAQPKGFGANHNQAFANARGRYFCVLNPDIRINADPFLILIRSLAESTAGISAPLVHNSSGLLEDSARRFPTPLYILRKAMGFSGMREYQDSSKPNFPDWVGGMAMLFPRAVFERLGGFDSRYFMYYEDVDICARTWLLGYHVIQCPMAKVVHDAQRSSHRSFKYLRWHLTSMCRFFLSPVYWRVRWFKLSNSQAR